MSNVTHESIWKEYQEGIAYKNNLDLYETVKENEDYYNDKQWGDLVLNNIEKPVLNFIKPSVNLFVALLISDDIAVKVEMKRTSDAEMQKLFPKIISGEVEGVLEYTNLKYHNRRAIRNAALDGDSCIHLYFDAAEESGELVKGKIKAEVLDNTNVYFGDTSSGDVQTQPYIILAYRRLVSVVKKEAERKGINPDLIKADSEDYLHANVDRETNSKYTTVLRRMWRDDDSGTIWCSESVRGGFLVEPFDMEYDRYPISWMTWEEVKNSYHGVSPVTGKIANQQFVNKAFAMGMQYTKMYAFPKVAYDMQKLPQGWNNDIGKAIAVNGNPRESILIDSVGAGQFNSQIIELANQTITQTKDLMGASDAALGNVKPDNTSAIIAVQKAANMPLDIQRLIFHNFVEEYVRNMADIMRVCYGTRAYAVTMDDGEEVTGEFDFSSTKEYLADLKVEIGQGSYWSELMQIQTLDALQKSGLIPDPVTYFECVPEGYIQNKQVIINKWKALTEQQMPQGMPAGNADPGQAAAEQIANNPLSTEISDEDLSSLLAELSTVPEGKRDEVINLLKVSEETKEMIRQLLEQGGNMNGMS